MMHFIYNFIVRLYGVGIWLASSFNPKAKEWIKGRKNVFEDIEQKAQAMGGGKKIWFHCASLGEFEQARPLIERIKKQESSIKIILSFFSPSGYNIRKNYSQADIVCYLPLDTEKNAERFLKILQPDYAVFIKYEFWYNYLRALHKKNIPIAFVSLIIRNDHYLTNWFSGWFREQLSKSQVFLTQDANTLSILNSWGLKNTLISGDTRFDRVLDQKNNITKSPLLLAFKRNRKLIICGSTWQTDIQFIETFIIKHSLDYSEWAWVIAPHNVNSKEIEDLERRFANRNYTLFSKGNVENKNILIVDNVGMLSSIYSYGTIAIIGGGFGSGIHNILEPAVFGLPCIFGPNYHKFKEAVDLINENACISFHNQEDFNRALNLLLINEERDKRAIQCVEYTHRNKGACEIVLNTILPKIS